MDLSGFIRHWAIMLMGALFCISAQAGSGVLELKPDQKKYVPGPYFEFFVDQDKTYDFTKLIENRDHLPWKSEQEPYPNFGFGDFAVWAHMRVQSRTDHGGFWYLINRYPLLDKMETYVVQNGKVIDHMTAGDAQPFKERTVLHPDLIFPIDIEPNLIYDVYVRVESTGAQQFILEWNEPNFFWQNDHVSSALLGAFYGIYAIMFAYNLILYFFVRDKSYLYYVFFIASFVLIQATLTGWAFQYLWPTIPSLQQWVIPVFVSAVVFFGALFSMEYMRLRNISTLWYRLYVTAVVLSVLIGIIGVLLPYWLAIRITVAFVILTTLVAAMASTYILINFRTRQAFFYCLAWSLMLIGGSIYSANKYGLIPITELSEHIIQAGGVLEVLLLSAALGDRFNQERKERFITQQTILDIQIKMNEELDRKVKERTLELEKLNVLLEEASITDSLTGVQNRRYFDKIFESEFRRAFREQKALSILLFDIDLFKNINDTYGHPFGDEVIKSIASIISRNIRRPPDCLARIGGEEFVVLLPHTPCEGAVKLAERIRTQVEEMVLSCEETPVKVTLSGGVASLQPKADDSEEAFFKMADEKLYSAKRNGRNRIES